MARIIGFSRSRLKNDGVDSNRVKFLDRAHAGALLAEKLADQAQGIGNQRTVLGIPRGGVVVADVVARRLSAAFDIVIPRKLSAPDNEELAVGAVMYDGTSYLNQYLISALKISQDYLENEKAHQVQEIGRRFLAYRKQELPYAIDGRTIILVDDGIATGATVIASARWVRKHNPSCLTIAVPVAPTQSIEILQEEADSVVAVYSTRDFGAVGQFYEHFDPISDEQVQAVMRARGLL